MTSVIDTAESDLRVTRAGQFRVRDLLLTPSLLSLTRVPLAACFPFVAGWPRVALAVLLAAGISDVLDGFYARRFKQVTAAGCVIDPLTDKLFVITVAVTLLADGKLSLGSVLLLSTREIGELPLVLWLALNPRARGARAEQPAANVPGKIATCLQFAAVSAALFSAPTTAEWIAVTAVAGILAAAIYWKRALEIARRIP